MSLRMKAEASISEPQTVQITATVTLSLADWNAVGAALKGQPAYSAAYELASFIHDQVRKLQQRAISESSADMDASRP